MTTALIFAGGTGQRINSRSKPKQFLELHGKPILIYTLEHFEHHPKIDYITVVCLESWIPEFKHMLRQYFLEKVVHVVAGGDSGDKSIYNGLSAMQSICAPEDIVLIHDGVRPLIDADLISENISAAKDHGAAITVEAVGESIVRLDNTGKITEVPPREKMYVAKAPQSFRYGLIWDLYQRAQHSGISVVDSSHLCSIYGVEMHTVRSSPNNLKITAPQDYYIFRALYEAMENRQILGF